MTGRSRRKSPVVIAAIVLTVVLGGARWYQWSHRRCCAPPPIEMPPSTPRPNDFAIEMSSGTGTVAPRYHYSYSVRIDATGRAELRYWPGYERLDSLMLSDTFHVASTTLDTLSGQALRLRKAPGSVPSSEQPIGGSSPRLTIRANGATTTVEPYQPSPWNDDVRAVEQTMRGAIPPALWARCEQSQRSFALSLDAATHPPR